MPFSAILLVFKFLMFSFLQVCKFTDLQVHNSIDCPYFYGLSVKISDLLHLLIIYFSLHSYIFFPIAKAAQQTRFIFA